MSDSDDNVAASGPQVARQPPLEIHYLPWAGLREEFSIGPVDFWPFCAKAEEKIADRAVREHLSRFIRCFVDNVGQPVESVVVCSCGAIDFRPLSETEARNIRAAVDCYIFARITNGTRMGVYGDSRTVAPPTADRYALYARNFRPEDRGLGIRAGSTLTYFTDMEEVRISRPFAMGGSFGGPDQELLQGLSKVFAPEFPADVQERLFWALEWYRLAQTGAEAVTWLSKVVMMATAFEILLKFPRNGKRKHFVEHMEKEIRTPEFRTDTRTDDSGKPHTLSLVGCWAWDFYELRSRIVHGDPVAVEEIQYKDWITHLIVSELVLLECMKRLLYRHGFVGDGLRRRAAECAKGSVDPVEAFVTASLPGMLGLNLDGVHEALGWIPPLKEQIKNAEKRLRNGLAEKAE